VTVAISESSGGPSSEVNSPVSFAMTENSEGKIKELDETMGNLGLGGTVDQSYLSQKDFTTRSGGVYSNIHQLCVIITEAMEENNGTDNAATHEQGDKSRSNIKKEKEKIHVSTEEWKIIMSAINHGTEVPANSRREVLMGYQYALHQHKKKLQEEKTSSGEVKKIIVYQVEHTGMNTSKHRIPAERYIESQSIIEEQQHMQGKRTV
jgi:hypothetical protein